MSLTNSAIWPIRATFHLSIRDQNGNASVLEANCLIHDLDTNVVAAAPTFTGAPIATPITTPTTTTTTPVTTQVAALKIILPADNSRKQRNTTINFIGNATTNVTDFLWTSDQDGIIGSTLSVATSGLRIGTHTIKLSGNAPTQSLSDEIQIVIFQ